MGKPKFLLLTGITVLILGIVQLLNLFLPVSYFYYIFNYQVLMIIIGIYLLIKDGIRSRFAWAIILSGIYLYLYELLPFLYNDVVLPIILIIIGLLLINKYVKDKKDVK